MAKQRTPTKSPVHADLPVLPVVITTLMSLDLEDDHSFDEVMTLARLDPSLAIKILQLATSASTAPGGDTLPRAMMCIGVAELRRLVSDQSTATIFSPVSYAEKSLWLHFAQVAQLTEALCKLLPGLKIDPDWGHLAGLLHDIGRMVFYDRMAGAPNEIESTDYDSPEQLLLAEAESLGRSHVEVGEEALASWKVPDYVRATILHHHAPIDSLLIDEDDVKKVVEVVQFADEISVFYMRHDDLDTPDFADFFDRYMTQRSVYLRETPLALNKLRDVAEKVLAQVDEDFLALKLGKPHH